MILPIITVPDSRLREISQPVKNFDKKFFRFTTDLVDTLLKKTDPAGVGLSAVQVAKLQRIFVVNLPPVYDLISLDNESLRPEIKLFINPEIIDKSEEMVIGTDDKHPFPEGCLSIPALYGPVLRHKTVKVKYLTFDDGQKQFDERAQPDAFRQSSTRSRVLETKENLIEKTDTFENFYARVIQHEYDHLDGVLFTDYTLNQNQDLHFDQGDRLVPVPEPGKLISW